MLSLIAKLLSAEPNLNNKAKETISLMEVRWKDTLARIETLEKLLLEKQTIDDARSTK